MLFITVLMNILAPVVAGVWLFLCSGSWLGVCCGVAWFVVYFLFPYKGFVVRILVSRSVALYCVVSFLYMAGCYWAAYGVFSEVVLVPKLLMAYAVGVMPIQFSLEMLPTIFELIDRRERSFIPSFAEENRFAVASIYLMLASLVFCLAWIGCCYFGWLI